MNGLFVYAIRKGSDAAFLTGVPEEVENDTDFPQMLEEMGIGNLPPDQRDSALRVLRRIVDTEWPRTRFYYSLLSFFLSAEGCHDLAVAAARHAVTLDPASSLGYLALAIALGESGDGAGACAAIAEAIRTDRIGYYDFYSPLIEALYERDEPETAKGEYDRLNVLGVFLPHALRAHVGAFPEAAHERVHLFEHECPTTRSK